MNTQTRTILVMAGGTGGHVFPALAVANAFRDRGYEIIWLGTRAGIEAQVVPDNDFSLVYLDVAGVRGQGIKRLLAAPFKIAGSVVSALSVIRSRRPVLVLGMGGFVTGPGGLAAWLSRTPLFIHEQNAVAGLTNRILARFATKVFQAFPDTFKQGVTTGNPVRDDILALPEPAERYAARADAPIRILVLGGSQGAVALNQLVPQALCGLAKRHDISIWHQAGGKNLEQTQQLYRSLQLSAKISPFIEDMAEAYGWADLVICRSGALTVCEVAAAGVASILIPYPYAVDDHQTKNGEYLVRCGAAVLRQQDKLSAESLIKLMTTEFMDRTRLLEMAEAARKAAVPGATESVVKGCLEGAGCA